MKISILIPNWNGWHLLEKNLPSVINAVKYYKKEKIEIYIVDDGSTDESLNKINTHFPQIKTIQLEKHSGFIKAVNYGVKVIDCDNFLLLNNDVSPKIDFLEPLVSHFKNLNMFAVGCLEESNQSGKKILSGRSEGYLKNGLLWHKRSEDQKKKTTFWVAGGSGIFSKAIWMKLGGFDEIFEPFYWEDIDLSYRALKSGYDIAFEPNSFVIHNHESTIGKTYNFEDIKIISSKNQFLFFWKNISDNNLLIKHLLFLPINLMKSIISDKALIKGFIKALSKLSTVLEERKQISVSWKKEDNKILSEIYG